jgi:RHS repeat-associated protein
LLGGLGLGLFVALAPSLCLCHLDKNGHRQSVTEPNGRAVSWTYDGIYRLTNETISGDPSPTPKNGSVGYGLDPVGNRSSETSSIPGIPTVASLLYDFDDRMVPAETYDNNGNTLSTGGRSFGYDSGNHLTSMNGAVTLVYDGDGHRVAKTAAGKSTTYLIDDLNPTGYAQVVEENVNGTPQRTYTYGAQRISQNQVINGTWTASFYGYDGFGNVRQLMDKTGAVTDTYEYDAWGNMINSAGTTPNNNLYRGEQYDSDLGLYYLRARYFNPVTGRFLTRDSKAGNPRGPATLHKYLYADGDPVNGMDPSGHDDEEEEAELQELDRIGPLAETPLMFAEGGEALGEGLGEGGGLGEGAGGGLGEAPPQEFVLRFSQDTARSLFSDNGTFANETISDIAGQLRSGALSPAEVPVKFVTIDSTNLIVNTRSSVALLEAGVPVEDWSLVNVTEDAREVENIMARLARNELTTAGTEAVQIAYSHRRMSLNEGEGSGRVEAPF